MTDTDKPQLHGADKVENPSVFARFLHATEIDARLLGMIGALLLIWIGFHLYGQIFNGYGAFLTPRNLWNLSVQTASIAVMATGMVLVIVTRHIDLSVGSILGLCATAMAILQVWILPQFLGLGHPLIWIIAVLAGLGGRLYYRRFSWLFNRLSWRASLYCHLGRVAGLARCCVFINEW